MVSTKEEVYSYLEQISRDFVIQDLKRFTANDISETLNISRNLASQYLNELVKEKRAIKVNSRPVYFFTNTTWSCPYKSYLIPASFQVWMSSS